MSEAKQKEIRRAIRSSEGARSLSEDTHGPDRRVTSSREDEVHHCSKGLPNRMGRSEGGTNKVGKTDSCISVGGDYHETWDTTVYSHRQRRRIHQREYGGNQREAKLQTFEVDGIPSASKRHGRKRTPTFHEGVRVLVCRKEEGLAKCDTSYIVGRQDLGEEDDRAYTVFLGVWEASS